MKIGSTHAFYALRFTSQHRLPQPCAVLEDGSFVKGQFAQHVYCIGFDLMCRSEIVVAVK